MRRARFSLIAVINILLSWSVSYSQVDTAAHFDKIYLRNGSNLQGSLKIIKSDVIEFIERNTGITYEFKKSEITIIALSSGKTISFVDEAPVNESANQLSTHSQSMTLQQMIYYEENKESEVTGFVCWFLLPCGGTIYTGSDSFIYYLIGEGGLTAAILTSNNRSAIISEAGLLLIIRLIELKDTFESIDTYNAELLNRISKNPALSYLPTRPQNLQLEFSIGF